MFSAETQQALAGHDSRAELDEVLDPDLASWPPLSQAQYLEVRFRDTGVGIPPAELKNLFIPFYTTKEKGTGLGLPISQRIIENHGGTIEVRSRVGVGSTFTVVLPVQEDAKAEAEARAS